VQDQVLQLLLVLQCSGITFLLSDDPFSVTLLAAVMFCWSLRMCWFNYSAKTAVVQQFNGHDTHPLCWLSPRTRGFCWADL